MSKRGNGEGTVHQRKDGRWEGKLSTGYKANGKPNRKTVYGKTQAEVIAKLGQLRQQLTDGILTNDTLKLGEYLESWLKEKVKAVKPSTLEQYESMVRLHITPRIGRLKLDKVKPLDVQAVLNSVAEGSGAPTANKCRFVLLNAYKQAIRWQLVARNPVEVIDPLPVKKREMKLWSPIEAARFLDSARGHRLYPLFYLDMSTGLRRGELLGLRWQDVSGNVLHIRQTLVKVKGQLVVSTPKTSKGVRRVSVAPDVLEVLEQHRQRQQAERELAKEVWEDNDLVFVSEVGTPLNPDNLKRLRHTLIDRARADWLAAAQAQGDTETMKKLEAKKLLPYIRQHDLRHLHASVLIRNGEDPKRVAARLGHARASFTLDTYTHLFDEQREEAPMSLLDFLPSADPNHVN